MRAHSVGTLNFRIWILLAILLFCSRTAMAIDESQYEAIRQLGALNGVALHCKYLDEVKRLKQAMIENVPKIRAIGQAFDDAANDEFLSWVREQRTCPSPVELNAQVSAAVDNLHSVFVNP